MKKTSYINFIIVVYLIGGIILFRRMVVKIHYKNLFLNKIIICQRALIVWTASSAIFAIVIFNLL